MSVAWYDEDPLDREPNYSDGRTYLLDTETLDMIATIEIIGSDSPEIFYDYLGDQGVWYMLTEEEYRCWRSEPEIMLMERML